MSAIIPVPRIPITVRPATMDDLSFIDELQKKHTKQVGWMPTKQLEGKIGAGHVLIAEEMMNDECGMMNEKTPDSLPIIIHHSSFIISPTRVGYLIGHDQYFKRDDVGIIYQINIAEGKRRGFIGAALLRAQFERSAYGCRLYCCWCAQDIEANHFWEAMGFVPLAFRAGSRQKGRVHIFWQRRIRFGDETTPYWFPAQTSSGSIREDRLVLPIPPGTHWRDVMPIVLPGEKLPVVSGQLPEKKESRKRSSLATGNSQLETPTLQKPTSMRKQFAPPSAKPLPESISQPESCQSQSAEKLPKPKKVKQKNDPRLIAAARELRDRWLEKVNDDPGLLISCGKYEVSRLIASAAGESPSAIPQKQLQAA